MVSENINGLEEGLWTSYGAKQDGRHLQLFICFLQHRQNIEHRGYPEINKSKHCQLSFFDLVKINNKFMIKFSVEAESKMRSYLGKWVLFITAMRFKDATKPFHFCILLFGFVRKQQQVDIAGIVEIFIEKIIVFRSLIGW